MDVEWPEVYDPWWDIRELDDCTDELEWTPTHNDISTEEED